MTHQFKVGDKVWIRTPRGHGLMEVTIDAETSRSWVVCLGTYDEEKFPKKNPEGMYSEQGKIDYEWHNNHRWRIGKLVDRCTPEQLRQIAQIFGYVEEPVK
jgi:hypothetical protein